MAKGKDANIGIGLGGDKAHNLKILSAASDFLKENNATIHIIGTQSQTHHLLNDPEYKKNDTRISLVKSEEPEEYIIKLLMQGKIDAVVRGSLSSSKFLKSVKKQMNIDEINRLTLLETHDGYQFFYGPVGIDECNNLEKKIAFIQSAVKVLNSLKISPIISVLSGGRKSDIGRDGQVDDTIKIAEEVVRHFQNDKSFSISHDEILIEKAIENKSNLIIAPEGISGNLIYRTLVHLGNGKAHGAIYMDINQVIIDTSRVGKISEIIGAFGLALALVN